MQEFKMNQLRGSLLYNLHHRFPNTVDDNAKLYIEGLNIASDQRDAYGRLYSGNASIMNEKKGIRLDFIIWLDIYYEGYETPDIQPNIESYLTREDGKLRPVYGSGARLELVAVILLNNPEPKYPFKVDAKTRRYFDADQYTFMSDKESHVLSKEGWSSTYVYDPVLGMRPTRDDEWIDLGDGRRKLKEGLEIAASWEWYRDLVKEFIVKRYQEKIALDMYIEL